MACIAIYKYTVPFPYIHVGLHILYKYVYLYMYVGMSKITAEYNIYAHMTKGFLRSRPLLALSMNTMSRGDVTVSDCLLAVSNDILECRVL